MPGLVITLILIIAFYLLGMLSLKADDWTSWPSRYHFNGAMTAWGLATVVGIMGFSLSLAR